MIVPMRKYAFLVYHREYKSFLEKIQKLGLVHVIEKSSGEIEDEDIREKHRLLNELQNAINELSKTDLTQDIEPETEINDVLLEYKSLRSKLESTKESIAQLLKDKGILEIWGDFEPSDVEKLKENKIKVLFYSCSERKFDPEWENEYYIEVINKVSGQVYFVMFANEGTKIEIDADFMSLPNISLHQLNAEIGELKAQKENFEKKLKSLAFHMPKLQARVTTLQEEIDFGNVVLNSENIVDDKLILLEGWIPEEDSNHLEKQLEKESIYYESYRPGTEEKIPVKLKNNKFNRLYEYIGDLYTMPDYKELDLTPFFAPFFMLFFGFCLGDAGYGLLIVIGTLVERSKLDKKLKPIMTLGFYLGLATIVMGIVSGTFFGIDLINADIHWLESFKGIMLDPIDGLMPLAIALGFVQTVFGMGIKAANQIRLFGWRHALSTFGWIIIVLGGGILYLLHSQKILGMEEIKGIAIVLGVVGGIPIMFLNSPGKNPFLNFGLGIWDAYGMVSGLLGDLLSYIRLFALGISSAVLGRVFNQLALDLSGDIPVVSAIIMVLILLFGHSLNFFMASLGSFVHPLRLTFVEFYKNAGFMGGGVKYKPFEKRINT